jgi:hypothetical protein
MALHQYRTSNFQNKLKISDNSVWRTVCYIFASSTPRDRRRERAKSRKGVYRNPPDFG